MPRRGPSTTASSSHLLSSWKENDTFFFLLSKTCSGCGGGRRRRRNLPPSHSTVSLLPHCSSTPLFTVGAPSHTHAGSARLLCPIHSRLGLRLQTYTPHPLQHTAVSVCQIAQAQPVSSFPPPLHRSLFQTSFSTHHPRLRPGCVLYFLRVSVPVPPPPLPPLGPTTRISLVAWIRAKQQPFASVPAAAGPAPVRATAPASVPGQLLSPVCVSLPLLLSPLACPGLRTTPHIAAARQPLPRGQRQSAHFCRAQLVR